MHGTARDGRWWRDAVVYEVYPRSFADGDGDGVGDLAGVRARLPHLAALGVDALWFTPWYLSPQADGGYDVACYRRVDPLFGDLAQAEALVAEAHALGLRVVVDIVPNHVSHRHPWFEAALAAGPGSPERARFWFRRGRGPGGDLPPNAWRSSFGGPAWTRVPDPDRTPGEWYLHLFSPEQPDLNWQHPHVHDEHEAVLRFWFDRGVDGVRVDSATMPVKHPDLPDLDPARPHPYVDRPGVHEVYRAWRAVADAYDPPRAVVGEVWLPVDAQVPYLRADEMHTVFNFDHLTAAWDAAALRTVVDVTLAAHRQVGAPPTWVLGNHDVTRQVTRFGRAVTGFDLHDRRHGTPTDPALGRRRARAALALMLALPGSCYLYQGDELGLDEVEDLPDDARRDPVFARTHGADPGRDGCRVPLPWSGTCPPFGFSPPGATAPPWLPQPARWAALTVEAQQADPGSMLTFYRTALATRRTLLAAGHLPDATAADHDPDAFRWLSDDDVLAFARGARLLCVANLGAEALPLPDDAEVALLSGPLDADGLLPPDTCAWVLGGEW